MYQDKLLFIKGNKGPVKRYTIFLLNEILVMTEFYQGKSIQLTINKLHRRTINATFVFK